MIAFALIAACAHHRQDAVEREEEPEEFPLTYQRALVTREDLEEAAAESKAYAKRWEETGGYTQTVYSKAGAVSAATPSCKKPNEEMLAQMDPETARAIREKWAYCVEWTKTHGPVILPGETPPAPKPRPSPSPTTSTDGSPLVVPCPEGREPRTQAEMNGCLVKTGDAFIDAVGVDHPK